MNITFETVKRVHILCLDGVTWWQAPKIVFILTNGINFDEMLHAVASHLVYIVYKRMCLYMATNPVLSSHKINTVL